MEVLETIELLLTDIIEAVKLFATTADPLFSFIVGVLIIIFESMVPIIPLSVFITLNILVFGNIQGFLISYVATLIGCTLSFFLFRKGFRTWLYKKIEGKEPIKKIEKSISNIDFSSLVLIVAMPFTPAFLVNIAAGLSKMEYQKFIKALAIGKIFMVYFWAFVGTTLIESFTDTKTLIQIILFMLFTYFISKVINKKFDIG